MTTDIEKLLQRCSVAQRHARSLLERHVRLVAAHDRLNGRAVSTFRDFVSASRDFYDIVAARDERNR